MALIVNADDLGLNESINSAICEAVAKGIVDRTTLLVNMEAAQAGMELAGENGFADRVGLHLNLTSGKPLTDSVAADRIMCNGSGEFTAEFARDLKTRFFLPKSTVKNVEAEIRAQFDRYRELGGTLWHIDSHHHVHTDPSIWRILKRVIPDYPVTSVRLGRNMYRGGNPLMHIYKHLLNASIRRFCKKRCDLFGSAADYEQFFKTDGALARRYDIEVMVHPAYDDAGGLCDICGGNYLKLSRPD